MNNGSEDPQEAATPLAEASDRPPVTSSSEASLPGSVEDRREMPASIDNPDGHKVLSKEQADKIVARLAERQVTLPCPRCGNEDFAVEDAILKPQVQDATNNFNPLASVVIPMVVTSCTRCGFISLHAMGTLGFMSPSGYAL